MKILEAFFEPVNKSLLKGIAKKETVLGNSMSIYTQKFPETRTIDVAIIGLGENANLMRPHLYKYSNRLNGLNVADFGNLKHNNTEKNLNAGLTECLIALKEESIIPIIIGEANNYIEGLIKGIDFNKIDYALVSPQIAYDTQSIAYLLNAKNRLFHASFIAMQSYFNTNDMVQDSSEVFSEHLRLGDVRANTAIVEPLLRQADIFDFDLSAIKYSEFQSATQQLPNGLMNHEACGICRYAGISNTLSYYLLRNFKLTANNAVDACQIAQMIWYLLDGIDNRFNDMPQLNHRNFTVYKCHASSGIDMVFLNSNLTGRWWLQIPPKGKGKKTAPKYIGCQESDFEIAQEGDVPEKWFRAMGSNL